MYLGPKFELRNKDLDCGWYGSYQATPAAELSLPADKPKSLPPAHQIPKSTITSSYTRTGFYIDDEQIAWELGGDFETPKSVCFMVALPSPQDKDRYDIIEYRLPLRQDDEGLLAYNHSRSYLAHTTYTSLPLSRAIHELAAYANPSLKSLAGYTDRALPRIHDNDGAFQSFLDAVNFQIGEYELSDMPSLPKIEDVVADPSMEDNLPAILFLGTEKNYLSKSALNIGYIKPIVTLRENPDQSPFAFRMERLKRQVTKKPIQTDISKPATQMPDTSETYFHYIEDGVPYKQPSIFMLAFQRTAYRHQDIFNRYYDALLERDLEIVDYRHDDTNAPANLLNGILKIRNSEKESIKFHTRFNIDSIGPDIFEIAAEQNLDLRGYETKDTVARTGKLSSNGILLKMDVDFVDRMAETTSDLFNRQAAMNKVGFAEIIATVKSHIAEHGIFPPDPMEVITVGPLKGDTWKEIILRIDQHPGHYRSIADLFWVVENNGKDSGYTTPDYFRPTRLVGGPLGDM